MGPRPNVDGARPTTDVGPVDPKRTVDPADWDRFVESIPGAPSYVRHGWVDLIAGSFRLPAVMLASMRDGKLCGVLPLIAQANPVHGVFLTSLPFVNYGGIVASDDAATSELLAACAVEVRRRVATQAELRHLPGREIGLPSSTNKVRPVLDLPIDPAPLWDRLGTKLRSQIRRPTKDGLHARVGGSEYLDDFYGVLSARWRQLGSPVYQRAFFARILTDFPREHAIVTVRKGDLVVGAGWLHLYRGSCEIPWAATLVEWNRLSPNMLLYWCAIETAIARGCSQFDFGRSTEGAPTHAFKMQWGPRCEPLPWHYLRGRAETTPGPAGEGGVARAFRRAWSKLPLAWTIRLGHAFARRLPF